MFKYIKNKAREYALTKILHSMSYDDINDLYEIVAECADEIENPELLLDVAETLRNALETRDIELIAKARKQVVLFFLSDEGRLIVDDIFDGVRELDDVLFDDEDWEAIK